MSFVADTQTKLDTAARKLQQSNPSAANRLFRLSAAVGHGPNSMFDAWAASDIHRMIDAHVITEQMRAKDMPGFGLRFLEWIRNLLIFIPLVLTWYGISSAVSSYSTFVNAVSSNAHADKTQLQLPFLYLWQQGFGGYLPGWLVLSRLAFYDFLLLLVLVLLTGIVNIRTNLRTSRKEQEAELLQEELTDALADATLCLTNRRGPLHIAGSSGAGDISQQLMEQMEKEREHREQELIQLKNFANALTPLAQQMLDGATHVQRSADQLTNVLQSLTGPIQRMASDQQQLLASMGQLIQLQGETGRDVKQLVSDQQSWGQSLEQAVRELVISTRNLNQFPAMINQLGLLVGQLSVEHQAQTTVTQQTTEVAARLQAALEQFSETANYLRSMSKDFFDIAQTQRDFPNAVRMGLSEVIRDYNSAAASVAQGGNNLSQAARMLYDVANRLNGVGNGQVHP